MTGGMHRLFAMGADSWQLAKRLQFLQQVEGARLQGHTGQLTMSDDGAIVREQLWARFTGGTPELMTRPEEQYETGEAAKSRSL
jgi:outer membrane PBP1 activator LpoA protein